MKTILKEILVRGAVTLFALMVVLSPNSVIEASAQEGSIKSDLRSELEGQVGFEPQIGTFVTGVVNFLIILGAIACLLYMIWGAIDWVTSGGEEQNYAKAKNKITAAVMGLVLLTAVWAIWELVLAFLGLDGLFGDAGGSAPLK